MLIRQHKSVLILCAFIFVAIKINAQGHTSNNFYGLIQTGVVFNKAEVGIQPGLAAGWQKKGFGLGLATSIDFLSVRSLQAGLDLRKAIHTGKVSLLAFFNPGFNLVIPTQQQEAAAKRLYEDQQYKNGHYLEGGAGILLGKKKNLLTAFYWSRKTYKENYSSLLWNPVLLEVEKVSGTNKYVTNRLAIKLGFLF